MCFAEAFQFVALTDQLDAHGQVRISNFGTVLACSATIRVRRRDN
jgi:hypothetical protein